MEYTENIQDKCCCIFLSFVSMLYVPVNNFLSCGESDFLSSLVEQVLSSGQNITIQDHWQAGVVQNKSENAVFV